MPDLPTFGMAVYKKPFANTGCDYFGPLMFKEGGNVKTVWGLLFTCITAKVIHEELVTSTDLSSYTLVFFRFVDLREPVSSIYSDTGTAFKAAAHVLPQLLQSEGLQPFF